MDLEMASCSVELNSLPEKKKRKKLNRRREALKDSNDTNHDSQEGTSLIKDTPLHIDSHVEPVINISSESAQSNVSLTRSQRKRLRKKINRQLRKLENNDLQGGSSTVKITPLEIESSADISTKTNLESLTPLEIESSSVDISTKTILESLTPLEIESSVGISTKTNLETLPLNSDLCLPQKQKKRRKRKRKRNSLENNDKEEEHMSPEKDSYLQPPVNIGLKNESGVAQPHADVSLSLEKSKGKEGNDRHTPLEIESSVDISTKTNLETLPLNSDLCLPQKQKKRKKRKRKRNSLENNDKEEEHMSPEKDPYLQPPLNIGLKHGSGVAQPHADVSLSLEKSKGKKGNDRHTASQNNGADCDLQMANGKHIEKKDLNSVSEVAELQLTNMKENFLVPEKQSGFPSIANNNLMEKDDVHPEVDPVASEMKVNETYRRKKNRKRRKTSDSLGNSLEPMNESGMRQSSISFDHPEAAHSANLSENKLDSVRVGGYATSVQVLEDIEMKEGSANCLDGEPSAKRSSKRMKMKNLNEISEDSLMKDVSVSDLPKKHIKLKNSGKLDEVQMTVLDALHRDSKDQTCDDLSGCATSYKYGEQKNVEVETKLEENVPSVSHLGEIKDDVDLDVTVKKENASYVLHPSPERACIGCPKKKLLILDVNGLLADIVPYAAAGYKPDIWVSRKAVFKRPFCDDFLRFCFERFDVGVWSSRAKKNVDRVINFLMGDSRHNLLFCWNQSYCTATRFSTLENRKKPLVLKELRKLWEKRVCNLPWEKGEYNESNTLLIDDSPYKALRNPANTAIFPYSYQYTDENDFSLGPKGDLRKYLEDLAMAENVQKYVEQNPFGQQAITESSPSWDFYSKVISSRLMPMSPA